jgi:hypothetical protein
MTFPSPQKCHQSHKTVTEIDYFDRNVLWPKICIGTRGENFPRRKSISLIERNCRISWQKTVDVENFEENGLQLREVLCWKEVSSGIE